jgi:hypothetical protein
MLDVTGRKIDEHEQGRDENISECHGSQGIVVAMGDCDALMLVL